MRSWTTEIWTFEITDSMTVRKLMLNELCLRGLTYGEAERAFQYVLNMLGDFVNNGGLDTKQGGFTLFRDCWDTSAKLYTEKALHGTWKLFELHAFTWLVNQLHSRS